MIRSSLLRGQYRRRLWASGLWLSLPLAVHSVWLGAASRWMNTMMPRPAFQAGFLDSFYATAAGIAFAVLYFGFRLRWLHTRPELRCVFDKGQTFRLHYVAGLLQGLWPVVLYLAIVLGLHLRLDSYSNLWATPVWQQMGRSLLCYWMVYTFTVWLVCSARRLRDAVVCAAGAQWLAAGILQNWRLVEWRFAMREYHPLHLVRLVLCWIRPVDALDPVITRYGYSLTEGPVVEFGSARWLIFLLVPVGAALCLAGAWQAFARKDVYAPPAFSQAWNLYPLLAALGILRCLVEDWWPVTLAGLVLCFLLWLVVWRRGIPRAVARFAALLCGVSLVFFVAAHLPQPRERIEYEPHLPPAADLEYLQVGLKGSGSVRLYGPWSMEQSAESVAMIEQLWPDLQALHTWIIQAQQTDGDYLLTVRYAVPKSMENGLLPEFVADAVLSNHIVYEYRLHYADVEALAEMLAAIGIELPAP